VRITVSGDAPVDMRRVRAAIRAAVRPYRLPRDADIGLAFVDDTAMRELNKRHRRKDRTTDVLSFGQRLPRRAKGATAVAALGREPDGSLELGDIVISGAQAARQARRRRHSVEREVAFLAAHGALHLLGFEDDTMAGYREMVALGEAATARAFSAPAAKARRRGPRGRRATSGR
jgi:probable rRNA maturation factor